MAFVDKLKKKPLGTNRKPLPEMTDERAAELRAKLIADGIIVPAKVAPVQYKVHFSSEENIRRLRERLLREGIVVPAEMVVTLH